MNKIKIPLLLGLVAIVVISIILLNAFTEKRDFKVYYGEKSKICFLVDNRYEVKLIDGGFDYTGNKNIGSIRLKEGQLSKEALPVNINGFRSGYYKEVNKRIYEYILNDNEVLVDIYENIEKIPVNLVPYREECEKIMQKFTNHILIPGV